MGHRPDHEERAQEDRAVSRPGSRAGARRRRATVPPGGYGYDDDPF